ncbi:hypothetical protein pb186bvf_009867 [Paramecium bursaria]
MAENWILYLPKIHNKAKSKQAHILQLNILQKTFFKYLQAIQDIELQLFIIWKMQFIIIFKSLNYAKFELLSNLEYCFPENQITLNDNLKKVRLLINLTKQEFTLYFKCVQII